jgi:hypothetical protein
MKRLLNLLASLRRPRRRPAHPPRLTARLHLENLEGRLVPSASKLPLSPAALGPVLAAPEATGGAPTIPISPDRPVHGYKWRKPWWAYYGNGGAAPVAAVKVVIAETQPVSLHVPPHEPPAPPTVAALGAGLL